MQWDELFSAPARQGSDGSNAVSGVGSTRQIDLPLIKGWLIGNEIHDTWIIRPYVVVC